MNSSQNENSRLSPIAIFSYTRKHSLQKVIANLKDCRGSEDTDVYLFSDGPKKESDVDKVKEVREFIKTINGFNRVHYYFSEDNKGLAQSIIDGVSKVLNEHGKIIVLEDDLLVSANFIEYMNYSLRTYADNPAVFSISGYTVPIKIPDHYQYDNYFTLRGSSWGWATWSDRWDLVDWEVLDYENFSSDPVAKRKFNQMGSDMTKLLKDQMEGNISSWAIRWCYCQFKQNLYSSYPVVSKVTNIGFGEDATHTQGADKRFATPLDTGAKTKFNLKEHPILERHFIKQFTSKYSLYTRAYYKIKNLFSFR